MAAGCPVVAANSGGIPDIVTDGVNGYLFDPKDDLGAIKATQKLLQASGERETLRQNAVAEAEKWGWARRNPTTAAVLQYRSPGRNTADGGLIRRATSVFSRVVRTQTTGVTRYRSKSWKTEKRKPEY
jgi:hypothetical protein